MPEPGLHSSNLKWDHSVTPKLLGILPACFCLERLTLPRLGRVRPLLKRVAIAESNDLGGFDAWRNNTLVCGFEGIGVREDGAWMDGRDSFCRYKYPGLIRRPVSRVPLGRVLKEDWIMSTNPVHCHKLKSKLHTSDHSKDHSKSRQTFNLKSLNLDL